MGHGRSVSWVGRGRGSSGGGAHRQPAAASAAAGQAGEGGDLRRWLGGRRATVELEEGAGDPWVCWN
jgi:hypothetical protein